MRISDWSSDVCAADLIGGLAALARASGGLQWLADAIAGFARGHTGRRAGEFSIAALAALGDFFTANNTVAILVGGGLAKDIAVRHSISPKRSASLLDLFACLVEAVLPFGAQVLLAGALAAVSPLALAGKVYYCWILAAVAVGFMLAPYRGKLVDDWGPGFRSWVQRADVRDKPILEIRRLISEPAFPGFLGFIERLSTLATLPASWRTALSSVSGVYILVCPTTGQRYVGSAYGAGGFWGRWEEIGRAHV